MMIEGLAEGIFGAVFLLRWRVEIYEQLATTCPQTEDVNQYSDTLEQTLRQTPKQEVVALLLLLLTFLA